MKKSLILLLLLLLPGLSLRALDEAQQAKIVDQLNKDKTLVGQQIETYEKTPGRVPDAELWPVAVAYAMSGRLEESERLFQKYLAVKPDNARAMRGYGAVQMSLGKVEGAVQAYTLGWKLGDLDSLKMKGVVLFSTGDKAGFRKLMPELLAHKDRDIDIANSLMAYALDHPKDAESATVFAAVLKDLKDEQVLARRDTTLLVIDGLILFSKDTARVADLKRKAVEKGVDLKK
ncbi:MAG: hypothetical protein SFY92_00945 [Verrucomicrobiae bacterium]|nr:hypothetical protein [Verrucomicrobiae bacterium]